MRAFATYMSSKTLAAIAACLRREQFRSHIAASSKTCKEEVRLSFLGLGLGQIATASLSALLEKKVT